jgi:cytochrome c oxidase subunit 2
MQGVPPVQLDHKLPKEIRAMKLKKLVVLCLFSAVSFFSLHDLRAQAATQRIQIVAERFDFVPGEVTVKKGVPVTIVLTSKDVPHGVKFKDFNVVLDVKKGETKEITFTPDKTGTFVGQCSVFCGSGHGAMKFTLHVTE